ncbi:MAG: glycosyltransferase [Candidatus Aminicenantales bacterium]
MELIQIIILFLLLLLFLNLLRNIKMMNEQKKLELKEPLPLVSVLVPMRNEERNIENCLRSLLKQDYPCLEIIVLDDNSTDSSYEIAHRLTAEAVNLKVVKGKKLPPGWNGKNWACHQLSQLARGEWFLFTDADTVHTPHSISTAVASSQKNSSVFVTTIPGLSTKTWSEKLYLPIIHFAFLVLLPFKLINYSQDSRISCGIGPFMLIERKIYFTCGGYNEIRREIVDDMALAKLVKEYKGKITVLDGTDMVNVRFYRNFRQLWKGFSKNHYEAIGAAPHYLAGIFIIGYFLFIYPYLTLWAAIEAHAAITLPLLQVVVITIIKITMAIRFKTDVFYSLLHPLTIVLCFLIFINSFRLSLFKKKIEWKERLYPID